MQHLHAILLTAGFWFVAVSTVANADQGERSDMTSPFRTPADHVLSIDEMERIVGTAEPALRWRPYRVDLRPAQWIWLPSERTLPNTFVLFRREMNLSTRPRKATGWMTADSRYLLTVNGKRVQWGPAPCDPRNLDVDPIDLTSLLRSGKNVIGVEVLYFGHGDGTWAAGKPGMIFNLSIEHEDGCRERITSDSSWQVTVDRAHRPGQFKRWYLRSLQEEFDARLHPFGWNTAQFMPDARWTPAATLDCPADKPAACSSYSGGDLLERVDPERSSLRMRQIPLMREAEVPAKRLAESGRVDWLRDPDDWFQFRMPNSFRILRQSIATAKGDGSWEIPASASPGQGQFVIFEFREEITGWPHFTIDAPEGTIVEMMCQEAHDPAGPAWLDTQYFNWSRFICREGVNRFEPFDFEALRWLQLHVRNASRPVIIRNVGIRRPTFDWPNKPRIVCSEPALQRLFDASLNTICNSTQGVCSSDAARERQQYSGDGGHQLLAIRSAFGEQRAPQRFLRTFSEGLTKDGYFMDCWPAFDRLARVMQRTIDGPLGADLGPRHRFQF